MLLDLTDERAEDPGLTGAKASWLARGLRAGLPVLPGAVVPAALSRPAMRRGLEVMEARGSGGARLAISQEPLDADLADAVVAASRTLGETLVVRSSSLLEGGGEWSGAFTSYLDLSPDETPVGVRGCWASAFTVNTLERYEASGVEPGSAPMAVLIQPALTPEFGGVARLIDGEVSVIGVVGSPVPLVQGWDPGVHAQVSESGVVKGDSAISSLGEPVIRRVADALRSAERAIGANTCEWAVAAGAVALLQLGRAEFREKQALDVPEEFASPEIGDLARLVRRFPGPLGEELVLPWAVASPASFLDVVDPIDVEPLEAFVEASQQARALTAEVWGARKADSSDRAAEAVRELRGDQPMRSVGAMLALRAPDADRSNAVLGLLATVRAALVEAGAVGRPEQAWHLSSQEIMDVLRAGRASEMRSRIGFDRWEPFDAAVVVAQGRSVDAVSAASGIGVGRLCFVDDPSTALDFRPRDVVVGLRPTPKLAPLLWDASALITTGGGPAAHLFESARALAIPAVSAVDLESLVGTDLVSASGKFSIAVDGNEGRLWAMPW